MPDDPPATPPPAAPAVTLPLPPVPAVPDDWKVHVTQLREENKQRRLRETAALEQLTSTEAKFGAIVEGMGLPSDATAETIAKTFADIQQERAEAQTMKREQAFAERVAPLISEAKYDEKLAMRLLGHLAHDEGLSDADLKSHVETLGVDYPSITAMARSGGQLVRPGGGPDRLSAGSGSARSSDEVAELGDQDFAKWLKSI